MAPRNAGSARRAWCSRPTSCYSRPIARAPMTFGQVSPAICAGVPAIRKSSRRFWHACHDLSPPRESRTCSAGAPNNGRVSSDLRVMLHAGTMVDRTPAPAVLLDVWSLPELMGVRLVDGMREIGAAEPYSRIIASREVAEHVPALAAAARTIGAAQIQNRG